MPKKKESASLLCRCHPPKAQNSVLPIQKMKIETDVYRVLVQQPATDHLEDLHTDERIILKQICQ
jgi:hypothetical protein